MITNLERKGGQEVTAILPITKKTPSFTLMVHEPEKVTGVVGFLCLEDEPEPHKSWGSSTHLLGSLLMREE